MSKILKTAAMVVGAVALVATGVGLAMGATWAASTTVAGIASVATIAKVATFAAVVLSVGASLTAKKPTAQATGSPTQFSADPDAGIPLVLGRTGAAGNIVMRKAWDTRDAGDNDRQAFISVLSLGPVAGIDTFTVDKSPVSFSAGAALGAFAGFMWMTTQLGATPEAAAMTFGSGAGAPPGWTAAHKLSGKAAAAWTLKFDTKGKVFQAGVPAPMWVVRGAKCYDPRKDSTYPGGSGPHRMADPGDTAAYDAASDTWEFTEDPYLLALHWAHGFWQRDRSDPNAKYQRVMGMGAPWATIDVPAFVEGANIAQANGWKCGGVIYSGDDKWASMKKILQAGMGEPLALGARVSCLVNAPKVSLATIAKDDLAGKVSVATTQPRRNRLNSITPRYRLEANNWQLLPGTPITVPEYVTLDKGKRSKTQDYPFIQDAKQVATAVRYDIENGREFGPITLPLKLVWMGYKPGDCVTVTLPEVGLSGQPVLLLNRDLEPATGVVTLTARSETAAKHPYALGQTTTPPPTPGVTGPLLVPTPGPTDWSLAAMPAAPGVVTPTLVITGACAANVDGVVFEYREFGSGGEWSVAGSDVPAVTRREITSVKSATQYEVAVSYVRNGVSGGRRIIGPVLTPTVSVKGDPGVPGASAFTLAANDANVTVTPNSVTKIAGGTAWNGGAYSVERYAGDVMVTGRVVNSANHQMVGLNSDNSSGSGYLDIDYAAYNFGGTFMVYASGGDVYSGGSVTDGAVVYVRRRGATVEFGVVGESAPRYVHSSGVDPSVPLGADIAIYEVGVSVDRITFQPLGADGKDGRDGLDGVNGLPGAPGANGQTSYVHFAYANSADGHTDFTTGGAGGRFYVGVYTDFTAADSADPNAYSWSLQRGADGANGTPGAPGANGQTTYVHVAYANSPDGTLDFHVSDPTGRAYIGVRTDFTLADSTNPADYSWSLMKGSDGADGVAVTASPATFVIPAFSSGVAKPGWTGGSCVIRLGKGGAEITAGVSYSVINAVNIASPSISGQTVTFAGLTDDQGEFTVRATLAGVDYDLRVPVTKAKDGSAAFQASSSISALGTVTGATPVPGGRTVTISGNATYNSSSAGRAQLQLWWRNATDGGTFNLLGTVVGSWASTTNVGTPTEPEYVRTPGSVDASFSFTAPAADKTLEYRADLSSYSGPVGTPISGIVKLEVTA